MPEVIVKYKSQKALKALQDLAKTFDMEIQQSTIKESLADTELRKRLPVTWATDPNPDVTALAGIWKDNPVTAEELRKLAWGDRA